MRVRTRVKRRTKLPIDLVTRVGVLFCVQLGGAPAPALGVTLAYRLPFGGKRLRSGLSADLFALVYSGMGRHRYSGNGVIDLTVIGVPLQAGVELEIIRSARFSLKLGASGGFAPVSPRGTLNWHGLERELASGALRLSAVYQLRLAAGFRLGSKTLMVEGAWLGLPVEASPGMPGLGGAMVTVAYGL